MSKLRLDLEQLEVESFTTDDQARERGTVRGNAEMAPVGAVEVPLTLQESCVADVCKETYMSACFTCAGTCFVTCLVSCKTCNTCFGGDSCIGGMTCMTGCLNTCPSGGPICCA